MIWAGFLSGFLFVLTTMAIRAVFGSDGQGSFDIMSLAPAVLAGCVGALIGWIKLKRMKAGSPPWTRDELRGLAIDTWVWSPFAAVSAVVCALMAWSDSTPLWLPLTISFGVIWLSGMAYRAYLIGRDRNVRRSSAT